MSEQTKSTTSNGHEIEHPREVLGFNEFRGMLQEYGLAGETAQARVEALRTQSKESLAVFMTDLNARLNGSRESLTHEKPMKIGEKESIAPEARYDLFSDIIDKIKAAPATTNPERIGDALALTTTLLHPFKDGNGRTARLFGYMFRDGMTGPEAARDFDVLAEPRDVARERGGFMINGYIPYMGEGADQSDPAQVATFIDKVLTSEDPNLYTGPYGQTELHAPPPAQPVQEI